ncbi:MAG: helix-turn-helix domain-containing protein [Gemmataceae bacterium]
MEWVWNGARLAEVIEAAGVTKKALAEKMEASPSNISRRVNNEREPSFSAFWSLAKALGIGGEVLLQKVGSPIKFELRPKSK